jgi:hypothetical protein
MTKLFDFKNKLEFLWWYRLISLQTVIQYSVVYLLYMNKSLKWIQQYIRQQKGVALITTL